MNWDKLFTGFTMRPGDDHCEHLSPGSIAPYLIQETDSFGPVHGYGMCAACYETYLTQKVEQTYHCHDCGVEFQLKEGILWKWWDFYPEQGDEALPICNVCKEKHRHKERVERNTRDFEEEMDYLGCRL